jgi:glycosyltransferase involved in cell wall biosynthesis
MKISIALATYNGEEFLQDQLSSFMNQGRSPDEVVICDDVSSDNTITIINQFIEYAPFRVRLFQNDSNLGFTKNFEKALSCCNGDIIFLSDQDDVWNKNKISTIEREFINNPEIMLIIHDGDLVDGNLVSQGLTKYGQVMAGYGSDAWFVTGALTAIRRDLYSLAMPIPEGVVGHDGWLHYIARMSESRLILDQTLELIRRHCSNTSNSLASSLNQINRFSMVREQFSKAPSTSYQNRMIYNSSLTERLRLMRSVDDIDKLFNIARTMTNLESERASIVNREALIGFGFIQRKLAAIKMLLSGDYQHFNGINSFFRDFLR